MGSNSIHGDLISFYNKIKLSSAKKSCLRESRNAIREEIKNYFKEHKNYNIPKFYIQGSMAMGTTVNPINEEFDIDDGIYLNCKDIDYNNILTWPSCASVHKIIYEACNQKKRTVTDKTTCVRVSYAKNYHVDFPIYIKNFNDENYIPMLANKKEGWIQSDPKANTDYYKRFIKAYGDILSRLIVYIKTAQDYYENTREIKLPLSGFEITLMCCQNIDKIQLLNQNDEVVLFEISKIIINNLKENKTLLKPVVNEDLWNCKNENDKATVIEFFEVLEGYLLQIINEQEYEIKKIIAINIFGNRFYKKDNSLIFNLGSLVHRLKMPWNYKDSLVKVKITATCKDSIKTARKYNHELLKKKTLLRFTANVSNPIDNYEIKWQVTNTGNEARNDNCLRGEFIDSNKGKYIREETTKYRGSHIVQCFLIKNNTCIAKSEEFFVNIL